MIGHFQCLEVLVGLSMAGIIHQVEEDPRDCNESSTREARAFSITQNSAHNWPGGLVKFKFDNADSENLANSPGGWFSTATSQWQAVAPWLRFEQLPNGPAANGVLSISTDCRNCRSDIGYDANKPTNMNLIVNKPECAGVGGHNCGLTTTTHELGHALGKLFIDLQ